MTQNKNRAAIYRSEEFLSMYRSNVLIVDIGKHFGFNRRTVDGWVADAVAEGLVERRRKIRSPLSGRQKQDTPPNAELIEQVRKLWADGMSLVEIGKIIGRTKGSTQGLVNRYKMYREKGKRTFRKYSEEIVDRIRDMKSRKMNNAEIGKELGMKPKAVAFLAQTRQIADRSRPTPWTPERIEELKTLWDQKLGSTEIGRIMGLTRMQVDAKATRMGLPRGICVVKRDYSHLHSAETRKKVAEANRKRLGAVRAVPKLKAVVVAPEVIPEHARPWLSRKFGECAYPYGERGNIHSCCQPTFARSVYCESHSGLCFDYTRKVAA